ncbi:MAG: SDR family oxidoreductase [bacterium]
MGENRPTALVTGSSKGIGRSAVLALAGAGHDVIVNHSASPEAAQATAETAEKLGAGTMVRQCDVADDAAVREMVRAVEARFGRLDVLINNAGMTSATPPGDMEEMAGEEWDRIFAVNVRGLFQVTRACAPLLRKSKGCIINSASIVGLRPGPQPLAYAASKAAVINLTRTLAGVLGPEVRVNAVAPGWVEGEWMQGALGENYQRLFERRASHTPLRRCATAEDVAETMMSLITGNRFVTGQVIVVDGGYSSTT